TREPLRPRQQRGRAMNNNGLHLTLDSDTLDKLVELVARRVLHKLEEQPTRTEVVSLREASQRLRLSEASLRKHVLRGHIPHLKAGTRTLIDLGVAMDALRDAGAGNGPMERGS